jgi:hypothetical protein
MCMIRSRLPKEFVCKLVSGVEKTSSAYCYALHDIVIVGFSDFCKSHHVLNGRLWPLNTLLYSQFDGLH